MERFKNISKFLKPYVPGTPSDDGWDEDGWVQREDELLAQMEKEYVETLKKRYPARGPAAELRRRYEAGEITEAEYLAERRERRRKQLG